MSKSIDHFRREETKQAIDDYFECATFCSVEENENECQTICMERHLKGNYF